AERRDSHSFPTRRSSDLAEPFARAEPLPPGPPEAAVQRLRTAAEQGPALIAADAEDRFLLHRFSPDALEAAAPDRSAEWRALPRSEEHTSELQSRENLVC